MMSSIRMEYIMSPITNATASVMPPASHSVMRWLFLCGVLQRGHRLAPEGTGCMHLAQMSAASFMSLPFILTNALFPDGHGKRPDGRGGVIEDDHADLLY